MRSSLDHLKSAHAHMLRARSVGGLDAAEAVRGWVSITRVARRATSELLTADPHGTVDRIDSMSQALASSLQNRAWPGDGPRSQVLAPVHAALQSSYRSAPPQTTNDVATAHRLIAATLWVGANTVAEATREHSFNLAFHRVPESQAAQASASDIHQRLKAMETLAFTGAFRPDVPSGSASVALGAALARWDLTAHRALMTDRSTITVHQVAFLETRVFDAFNAAVTRAHELGVIDDLTAERMAPAITGATLAWSEVASISSELAFGLLPSSPDVIPAAESVAALFNNVAGPATRAEDVDVIGTFTSHLATSMGVAATVKDLINDQELRAPAQAVNRLVRDRFPSETRAAVSPIDVHRRRSIVLPQLIRKSLNEPIDIAYAATSEVARRSAAFDLPYRAVAAETPTSSNARTLGAPERHRRPTPLDCGLRR